MKRTGTIVLAVMMSLVFCVTAFAGSWKQDSGSGKWWYQNDDGSYIHADGITPKWQTIGGKYYAFDSLGWMYQNTTTPDGYQVGTDGAWIERVQTQNHKPEDYVGLYVDGKETYPHYSLLMENTNGALSFFVMGFYDDIRERGVDRDSLEFTEDYRILKAEDQDKGILTFSDDLKTVTWIWGSGADDQTVFYRNENIN